MKQFLWLIAILVFSFSCNQQKGTEPEGNAQTENPASSAETTGGDTEQLFAVDGDYAGSHILIAYQGADRANPEVTRTKEEALEKAKQLLARLRDEPGLFEELAVTESDGPSGKRSKGDLGVWRKGSMVPEFDEAVERLAEGQIAEEPVETQFGYHLIRRNAFGKKRHFGGHVFFVAHRDVPRVPPNVTRTREEAEVLAQELAGKVSSENFDEMAAQYNDFGPAPQFLAFSEDEAPLPGFLELFESLKFGEVTGPKEFSVGFGFFKRARLERFAGAHILITYEGARKTKPGVTRTREEALALAKKLTAQIKADPDSFANMALQHSEGPSAPRGGDMGSWFRGLMVPEFDNAISALAEGAITDEPVETPFGFHIIRRNPL